jgi:hypothetical protein
LYFENTVRKYVTAIAVSIIMIIGILGITNPGRKPFQMFDHVEGRLEHNYFIFSIYQQYSGFTLTENGKYRLYRRFLGIGNTFFEIKPQKIKTEADAP